DGMMHNAIVYRSVRMISEAAVSVPLSAYQGDNEVEEHPMLDLIFRSPLNNGTELLEQIYGYLLVAGNAYINALSVGGQLNALHTLRPDRVRVIVDSDGWPEAYEYTVSTQRSILRGEAVPGVRAGVKSGQ
ncbi:MAG: phage portal protein, partial [Pseudomonadota bacterium]